MKRYEYTEFIRYSENFKKDNLDFYGKTSPLGEKETKEFFAKYADALKNEYGEDCLGKQAVEKEQIDAAMALLSKKETLSFTAYKKKHLSGYKCWQLYTDRATIEKNTIILKDDYSLPTAAAKCEFPEHLKKLTLSVYFDEEYRRPIPGGALITTPGKQIDLRAGITDSVRLFFAEDGKLIVRENKTRDVYHYSDTVLCEYPFDKSFDIEFELGENNYTIFSLGKSLTLPYLLGQKPDTLFLSGGLQPTSEWRVEIATALNEDGKSVELFETEAKEYPMEKIGEVTLPYVIGTEKNKDKELILRTSFIAEEGLSYALRLEALDPLGEVYLNGNLVSTVKDFSQTFIYLDKFVSKGKNELELRIMPRAPELLYVWHRHKDPYNGWFSLSADLISGKKIVSDRPVIKLEGDMVPKTVKAIWNTGLSEDLIYKAYIRKSFPAKNDFVEIASGNAENGNLCFTFPCNYDLWSVDSPVLYEIRIDLIENGSTVYSDSVETGFRIVKQKNGAIYINGEKTVLRGALNMQFLPPYEEVPVNHVCPKTEQIAEQALALKNLNGNCLRLHQLGHGSSDKRFGEICDRLGVLLIWTTRAIDSAEQILWNRTDEEPWKLAELYKAHMRPFLNHPSIIMWEGSNELHSGLTDLDRLYDSFVDAVKEVDDSRLICPVSHLYYGGGLYGGPEVDTDYYNNDGTRAADGEVVRSSYGWLDESVVRSSHTYSLLLGYGAPWRDMVTQNWAWQDELFNAKDRAYIISEFAIIGRQNPTTKGADEFINKDSYELPNEKAALGYCFTDEEWELSQAYQALCADMAIRQLRRFDADGMLWCALWSGANNGSYLKPPIDFMGYRKLAFYRMRDGFSKCVAANEEPDALFCKDYEIKPICTGLEKNRTYTLSIEITSESGEHIEVKEYRDFIADSDIVRLGKFVPKLYSDGYYKIKYSLCEK